MDVMIERWSDPDGSERFLWSVWKEGKRLEVGGRFDSPGAAEAAARQYCQERFGREPERVRQL